MFIFVIVVYIATIVFTHTAVFLEIKKHKRRLQTEQLPDEEPQGSWDPDNHLNGAVLLLPARNRTF